MAGAYAEKNGKIILEQTSGGKVIDNWDEVNEVFSWNKSDMPPHGWDFWGDVSEKYSKGAKGSIDVIQSDTKFPGGGPTWRNREWPTIRDSGMVDKINIHKIDKAGNIIEMMRLDPKNPATNAIFGGTF